MSTEKYSYVNINDNLRYFLAPHEFSFLIRLKQLAYLRSVGLRTAYSREHNYNSFQIKRVLFSQSVERLECLGLLKRVRVGKYKDYILVEDAYNRLLKIATSTNNISVLLSFSEEEFILKRRAIVSITDREIIELRDRGG